MSCCSLLDCDCIHAMCICMLYLPEIKWLIDWLTIYLRQGGHVMPGVCLLARLQLHVKTTERIFAKILHRCWDASVDEEELVKFRKSSATASGSRNFLRIRLNNARRGIFPQHGSYLRREWSDFQGNLITEVSLDKEVPVKFWR